ncbi:MAG TPA: LacI family DNA-binding transcriptional regulator, partial [Chitinophagaceae bacterium]|nr:LacI family DNA-binding transcriptional regulator [Chitinophagaceae bacterium]
LAAASKLNYQPNIYASNLREMKSKNIAVIIPEIANNFFSQVINGIESIAYDRGYNVIISQTRESYEREVIDLQYLASRSVDGLLISLSTETNDLSHLKSLHAKGLPIVFFDRITEEINTHRVIVDNFRGAYDATEHLIKNGHKRIAVISNSEFLSITHERVAGYKEALIANGHEVNENYVQHCFYGGMIFEEIEDAINKLFTQRNKPDAIFATSDKLTTGCLKTLKRRGLKVPDDVSVVGFSNTDIAELIDPPLTVVRQPAIEMGKAAIELLLQLIESKRPIKEFEKRILTPELQIRESSIKKTPKVAEDLTLRAKPIHLQE